jgi:hypothetical protein
MKRLLAVFPAILLVAGCEKPEFLKSESEKATPIPVPTPAPVAAATPKPPDWMWKDYKNPLDPQKPKRR